MRTPRDRQVALLALLCILSFARPGMGMMEANPIDATTIVSIRVINAPVTVPWIQVQIRSCRQEDSTWLLGCQFVKPPPWSIMLLFG